MPWPRLPSTRLYAGSCSPTEKHKLWEVPLWSVADEGGQPIASMDPPGNAYENYKREVSNIMGILGARCRGLMSAGRQPPRQAYGGSQCPSAPRRMCPLRPPACSWTGGCRATAPLWACSSMRVRPGVQC